MSRARTHPTMSPADNRSATAAAAHSETISRRERRALLRRWPQLEQTEKLGHIKYFRIDPRRLGENVVVPLRRAT